MKGLAFSYVSLILLFFFLFTPQSFAQNITTGNASSYSKVETNIEGNGNVQTHIKVEANGGKKVLDADKSGKYEVNINSDAKIDNSSLTPTKTSSSSSVLTNNKDDEKENDNETNNRSLIQIVINNLSNFIKRIFTNL